MPLTQNYFTSHQWLRELKRSGARTLVAVDFRLSDDEVIWGGKYNETHERQPLGIAIRRFLSEDDPLGWEFFLSRRVHPKEILRVREVSQNVGWRYFPSSHGREPCGCSYCLRRGEIRSARIRATYDEGVPEPRLDDIRRRVAAETDPEAAMELLWALERKRRRADPSFLRRLLDFDHDDLHEELARMLVQFRHRGTRLLLLQLCAHRQPAVRQAAAHSLVKIDRASAVRALRARGDDPVIAAVLTALES
ncbi:MAG: HEAT repeat domain-containing protein [Phycisphaerae bacterium]|nr:HEAT repeat domain-containing protein [Phycisphaerae bacterium]